AVLSAGAAAHDYAASYVNFTYADDYAVHADRLLQVWAADLCAADGANIRRGLCTDGWQLPPVSADSSAAAASAASAGSGDGQGEGGGPPLPMDGRKRLATVLGHAVELLIGHSFVQLDRVSYLP
ncbi:unnamed protein product, partial [Phaeothamnion confervicola]